MRIPSSSLPARAMLAAASLLIAVAGCETIRKATGNEQSPFRMFGRDDMRAGMKYADLEDAAKRESRFHFNCWDTLKTQQMRMCKNTIESGDLFALVSPKGKVVRLLFISYEPTRLEENYQSTNFRASIEAVHRMMAEYDSILPRRTLPSYGLTEFRWVDAEPRWSAGMWFRDRDYYLKQSRNTAQEQEFIRRTYRDSLALVPDSIAITDEKAYSELLALNPRPKPYEPEPASATPSGPVAPMPPTAAERLAIMRSDLERLARAQDDYFAANSKYAKTAAALDFTPGEGVVLEIGVGPKGWTAKATHPFMGKAVCVVYGGSVPNPPSAGQMGSPSSPGQALCDPG